MNIRDFTVFQTVVQEKSISKASRILYMTPQGISKIIRNLENEMDCELLLRTPNGMEMTESGSCFLKYAEEIMHLHKEMKNEILHIQQKKQGVVDLLSAYGILRLVTPECIQTFRRKYPEIAFHYREYPDMQVERSFQELEGNVAFTIGDVDEELYDVTELEAFPIKLLVNEKHPLSRNRMVSIRDLKGQPLYIESREFKIHHLIMEKCRQAGFEPDIVFETSGFSLCHKMVKENKGISVTVDFIFDDMREKGLIKIPFSEEGYTWRVCMITRKGEVPGQAVRVFQEYVKEWLKQIRNGNITR